MKFLSAVVLSIGLIVGCGDALRNFDDVNNPNDDSALARCRGEGRAAREAGASKEDAYGAYYDCTKEAGLR